MAFQFSPVGVGLEPRPPISSGTTVYSVKLRVTTGNTKKMFKWKVESLAALVEKVKLEYSDVQFDLSYTDQDNDWISLVREEDLQLAVQESTSQYTLIKCNIGPGAVSEEFTLEPPSKASSGEASIQFGKYNVTGIDVAVKVFNSAKQRDREFSVLRHLQQKGEGMSEASFPVVPLVGPGVLDSERGPALVLRRGGLSLHELLQSPSLNTMQLLLWAYEAVEAVSFLHTRGGVVWGDLKPANFVQFTIGGSTRLRMIDFDSAVAPTACAPSGDELLAGLPRAFEATGGDLLTPTYAAPERVAAAVAGRRCAATQAIDVWALGMCLFRIFARRDMFPPTTEPFGDCAAAADGGAAAAESPAPSFSACSNWQALAAGGGGDATSDAAMSLQATVDNLISRHMGKRQPQAARVVGDMLRVDPRERPSAWEVLRRGAFTQQPSVSVERLYAGLSRVEAGVAEVKEGVDDVSAAVSQLAEAMERLQRSVDASFAFAVNATQCEVPVRVLILPDDDTARSGGGGGGVGGGGDGDGVGGGDSNGSSIGDGLLAGLSRLQKQAKQRLGVSSYFRMFVCCDGPHLLRAAGSGDRSVRRAAAVAAAMPGFGLEVAGEMLLTVAPALSCLFRALDAVRFCGALCGVVLPDVLPTQLLSNLSGISDSLRALPGFDMGSQLLQEFSDGVEGVKSDLATAVEEADSGGSSAEQAACVGRLQKLLLGEGGSLGIQGVYDEMYVTVKRLLLPPGPASEQWGDAVLTRWHRVVGRDNGAVYWVCSSNLEPVLATGTVLAAGNGIVSNDDGIGGDSGPTPAANSGDGDGVGRLQRGVSSKGRKKRRKTKRSSRAVARSSSSSGDGSGSETGGSKRMAKKGDQTQQAEVVAMATAEEEEEEEEEEEASTAAAVVKAAWSDLPDPVHIMEKELLKPLSCKHCLLGTFCNVCMYCDNLSMSTERACFWRACCPLSVCPCCYPCALNCNRGYTHRFLGSKDPGCCCNCCIVSWCTVCAVMQQRRALKACKERERRLLQAQQRRLVPAPDSLHMQR